MEARQAQAENDPRAQLLASGLGYFDFAQSAPALFRLMFASRRAGKETPELAAAGEAAFRHLVEGVARLRGVSSEEDASLIPDILAVWSMVHGFAELFVSGRTTAAQRMTASERKALLKKILDRAMAAG